jgi:predicted enzyme related to lactoylglutathione lyase
LYVDGPRRERDFYELFGFTTAYEGPEFPDFLAVTAGAATFGLSKRNQASPTDRGLRWQFTVDDVREVAAICERHGIPCDVTIERGGDRFQTRIARVTSPSGYDVWFEGPNER